VKFYGQLQFLAQIILFLHIRSSRLVSFTFRLFTSLEKFLSYLLNRILVDPGAGLDALD